MKFPEQPGHKDNGAGLEAAIAFAPKAPAKRARVMECLAGLPGGRGTAEQIAEQMQDHWYLVRPRLSELLAMGSVAKTGERGAGALGGKATVWRVTTLEEQHLFNARKAAEAEHG